MVNFHKQIYKSWQYSTISRYQLYTIYNEIYNMFFFNDRKYLIIFLGAIFMFSNSHMKKRMPVAWTDKWIDIKKEASFRHVLWRTVTRDIFVEYIHDKLVYFNATQHPHVSVPTTNNQLYKSPRSRLKRGLPSRRCVTSTFPWRLW